MFARPAADLHTNCGGSLQKAKIVKIFACGAWKGPAYLSFPLPSHSVMVAECLSYLIVIIYSRYWMYAYLVYLHSIFFRG